MGWQICQLNNWKLWPCFGTRYLSAGLQSMGDESAPPPPPGSSASPKLTGSLYVVPPGESVPGTTPIEDKYYEQEHFLDLESLGFVALIESTIKLNCPERSFTVIVTLNTNVTKKSPKTMLGQYFFYYLVDRSVYLFTGVHMVPNKNAQIKFFFGLLFCTIHKLFTCSRLWSQEMKNKIVKLTFWPDWENNRIYKQYNKNTWF